MVALASSCAGVSSRPCRVTPRPKDPGIVVVGREQGCGVGMTCLTDESAIEIGLWIRAVNRRLDDVDACPYVVDRK